MNTDKACDKSPTKEHCDHNTHELMVYPPIPVFTCCWCGRERRGEQFFDYQPHGQFANGYHFVTVLDTSKGKIGYEDTLMIINPDDA